MIKRNSIFHIIYQCYLRALFDYKAADDNLHPCPEIGLDFKKGDIMHIVNISDPNWWQAKHFKDENMSGLIPSPELEERRHAFVKNEKSKYIICGRKKKIKTMFKTENNQFDEVDFIPYQEVIKTPPFKRRTVIFVGPNEIECNALRLRFVERNGGEYETCPICKYYEYSFI